MAIMSRITCRVCKQAKNVSHSPARAAPSVCNGCRESESVQIRADALATQAAKPLEERLAETEAWIYDHKQVQHGYIPEPRF